MTINEYKAAIRKIKRGADIPECYWSRRPGEFVNRNTGEPINVRSSFEGNASEWYRTLIYLINEVSRNLDDADFILVDVDSINILEFTEDYKAFIHTEDINIEKYENIRVGMIANRYDVFISHQPFFPRNGILIGKNFKSSEYIKYGLIFIKHIFG